MACTLPKIFLLYDWYEKTFGDLCRIHDAAYRHKTMSKIKADWQLSRRVWNRGYPMFSVLTFFFVSTVGWYYWWRV